MPPWGLPQDGVLGRSQPKCFSLNILYQTRSPGPRSKTNCRDIEIPVIFPCPVSTSKGRALNTIFSAYSHKDMAPIRLETELISCARYQKEQTFPFLSLPVELRLRIYALVLPSRVHSIVTQYPHNGYYYSGTSMVSHTTQTLYPAQPYSRPRTPDIQQKFTTYKLLNSNFHHDFPNPSICPEILRTCKQIRDEAEPVMYGAEAVFDFGVYVDAIVPFLEDRSMLARRAIRRISIAREIPVSSSMENIGLTLSEESSQIGGGVFDTLWGTMSTYLRDHCEGLRTVNLTVWAENGGLIEDILPTGSGSTLDAQGVEHESIDEMLLSASKDRMLWWQWEWTRGLLQVEALRYIKVTWWGFAGSKATEAKFDGWLGRRMVADKLMKDRMVLEGRIIEGITMLSGDRCS